MIKATREIWSQFDDILILGGEPLLRLNELIEYCESIKNYYPGAPPIYVTTSLPIINFERFSTLMSIIDGLNVSLAHVNPLKANELLGHASHDRVTFMRKWPWQWKKMTTVCFNLVKGVIDTKENLLYHLDIMDDANFCNFKVRELQHCEELFVEYDEMIGQPRISPYIYGCSKNERLGKHNINVKRACFKACSRYKPTIEDNAKELEKNHDNIDFNTKVLMENGALYHGWPAF
jgi:hypothetical protein